MANPPTPESTQKSAPPNSNVAAPASAAAEGLPKSEVNPTRPAPELVALPAELWRSILLMQLDECWSDIRQIDGLVWQIPAGIGAILGLILTGLGSNILKRPPSLLDVGAMFGAFLITFSLIFALYKNRIFQISRNIYMKAIYKQLLAIRDAKPDDLVPVNLELDDPEMVEIPGLVALATRDMVSLGLAHVASSAGLPFASRILRRRSAYKTMLYVSISVLAGEFLLTILLLARFL